MKNTTKKLAGLTVLSLAIAGCGGGGGGGDTTVQPPPPASTFSIGGSVSGLAGSGLVLQNNSGDDLSVASDGGFTFSTELSSGASYAVTVLTNPTNPAQTCAVANGTGTANADVTNVTVDCQTNTASVDTDMDGLSDQLEASIGTSPILVDTDGDGLTDFEEQNQGGFDPLIADLPTVSIEVITDPSIEIDVVDTTGNTAAQSYSSTFETGQETSYSRSDTESTSATLEASTRVYSEAEVSASPGQIGGSAKTGSESSVSASVTQENSTSITSNSAESSRQEYGRLASDTNSQNRVTDGGLLRTRVRVTNTSSLTFSLESLRIGASRRSANGRIQTLGELVADNPNTANTEVANGGSFEADVERAFSNANDLESLMQDPSGLLFTVSNFFMTDIGTVPGRSWGEVSQDVSAQTAQVVIDYGGNANVLGGGQTVESYQVATNVPRDANGTVVGTPMSRLMEILGIQYTTIVKDVVDANGTPTGESRTVINGVRSIETESIADGFWYVFTSSDSADDPLTDFDDLVMMPRDRISIVFLRDQDGDELFDREEYLLGTSVVEADTDGDQLSDFEEAREGWSVLVEGVATTVFSNPLAADNDGDSWSDARERDEGTDPNNSDTDGDGIPDNDDPDPTGPESISFDTKISGPGLAISADINVVATGRDVTGLTISWGDGTSNFVGPDCDPNCTQSYTTTASHDYTSEQTFTVTVTAELDGTATESQVYQVGVQPRFAADLGLQNSAGWIETSDTRIFADVNLDRRVDIVAFGQGGIYTVLANPDGSGFLPPQPRVDVPRYDSNYDKSKWRRMVADVAGDARLDVVEFYEDGVYIFENVGGTLVELCPDAPCTRDFGVEQGYLNFAEYPRFLSDMSGNGGDGRDDIVAMAAGGVKIATSTGVGFRDQNPGGFAKSDFTVGAGGWDATTPRILADIDGDGFDDIVGFGNTFLVVSLYEQNFTFSDPNINYAGIMTAGTGYRIDRHIRTAVDMNGDGADDMLAFANNEVAVKLSLGQPGEGLEGGPLEIASSQFGFNDGWVLDRDTRVLADINGDGLPDIVGFGPNGSGGVDGVTYAINNGSTFDFGGTWIDNDYAGDQGFENINNPRFAGDVNGDGRADLIVFANSEVIVRFGLSCEGCTNP